MNSIQASALSYALQYTVGRANTTPNEIVEIARTFEDFLRSDREHNEKLNEIINEAIETAKEANQGLLDDARLIRLQKAVDKVQKLPTPVVKNDL